MSSIYSEYTIYKTNELVKIVPSQSDSEVVHSRMYLEIERSNPLTVKYVQSNGAIPLPPSNTLLTKPQKAYGILGFLPFTKDDVRMIIITGRKYVGDMPHPLFQVTQTDVIALGTDAASTVNPANPDCAEFRRLLGRITKVKSLFFATSWDATLNAQKRARVLDSEILRNVPLWNRADKRLFWNYGLVQPLIDIHANEWILPTFMGHAELKETAINGIPFKFAIVSRRHRTRAGMRLFARGIDSEYNTANSVETEQLLMIPRKFSEKESGVDNLKGEKVNEMMVVASYVMARGSIPVYWSQLPDVRYKPPMTLTEPHAVNAAAAKEHFTFMVKTYGAPVHCVNLIDSKGKEGVLAAEFEKCAKEAKEKGGVEVEYTHFDFHRECKGGKTERLSILMDMVKDSVEKIGYFVQEVPVDVEKCGGNGGDMMKNPVCEQKGCFRVNCIDSLDRTNVVQSLIARKILEKQFVKFGIFKNDKETIDDYPEFLYIYKNWWANHADTISNQYTGTGAQKTDITRVGKRTLKGRIDDGINAITRYYKNNFTDGDMQDAYNLFLGVFVPPLEPKGTSFQPAPSKLPLYTILGLVLLVVTSLLSVRTNLGNKEWGKCCGFIMVIALAIFGIKFVIKHYGRSIVNNPRLINKREVEEDVKGEEEKEEKKEEEEEEKRMNGVVGGNDDGEVPMVDGGVDGEMPIVDNEVKKDEEDEVPMAGNGVEDEMPIIGDNNNQVDNGEVPMNI